MKGVRTTRSSMILRGLYRERFLRPDWWVWIGWLWEGRAEGVVVWDFVADEVGWVSSRTASFSARETDKTIPMVSDPKWLTVNFVERLVVCCLVYCLRMMLRNVYMGRSLSKVTYWSVSSLLSFFRLILISVRTARMIWPPMFEI